MKTAICAIAKNEERYVREWAEWHLGIGVDHICLFEDYGSRSHRKQLDGLGGRVKVMSVGDYGIRNHHNTRTQYGLYSKFLEESRGVYDWVLFIDIDEFVVFGDGYGLRRLEEEFKDSPAVWLSWLNYGASGHIGRPDGGVMESYTKVGKNVESDKQWCRKSLVNVGLCPGLVTIHIAAGGCDPDGGTDKSGPLVYEKAWINHYFSKSWEDYCERIFERGNMSNNFRTLDSFFKSNPDMLPLKERLIEGVRYRHAKDTMWLSRDLGIISGGNVGRIKELEEQWQKKAMA